MSETMPINKHMEQVGLVLYGPYWPEYIAKELDVSERTIRRWYSGKTNTMPDRIAVELTKLLSKRIRDIRKTQIELEKQFIREIESRGLYNDD